MPRELGFGNGDRRAIEELVEKLEKAEAEAAEYREMLQRTQADFINHKRRTEQERAEQAKTANALLIERLLPVIDDFGRAIEAVPPDQRGQDWVQGVSLIGRKLLSTLEQEGLKPVGQVGEEFDPREHEAVMVDESAPKDDGKVTRVIQGGYSLNGRLLRPARVAVGKARSSK